MPSPGDGGAYVFVPVWVVRRALLELPPGSEHARELRDLLAAHDKANAS